MRSINETSHILLALDKALLDNRDRLTDDLRESLVDAVSKTITNKPIDVHPEGETDADAISNS
jgi:hypothetical protein